MEPINNDKNITESNARKKIPRGTIEEYLVDREEIEADRKKWQEINSRRETGKKNKRRKRRILLLIIIILAALAGGVFVLRPKSKGQEAEATVMEVKVGSGEEIKYVTILSIVGNEIQYADTKAEQGSGGMTVDLIPVGTNVYTRLGNVTTFSRLTAGDNIAMAVDAGTGEILRIYMQ